MQQLEQLRSSVLIQCVRGWGLETLVQNDLLPLEAGICAFLNFVADTNMFSRAF
jgi:hypothetical protein